jgi:hypothetical protein
MSDLMSMRERFGFGIVSSRKKDILRLLLAAVQRRS